MLRPAEPGDEPAIEAFLAQHAETSMFLRSNLREFGLNNRDAARAIQYWLAGDDAVFGLSNAGFAMSQAPGASPALWKAFAGAIAGRTLTGITGEAEQVIMAKQAFGVEGAAYALDDPEPLYRLDLSALVVPPGTGVARAPQQGDRALLEDWHRAYVTELRMTTPERAETEARERAEQAIASDTTRLLIVDGAPVARTQFNAHLPDMVQIGGVYTPPELRGRGYARRAVALHLEEARRQGAEVAILFASGEAASRAYQAIGFERIGTYSLAILRDPVAIGEQP